MTDRLLTTKEAARYLAMSESFLERDRIEQEIIPFKRVGKRSIRYQLSELEAYVNSRTRQSAEAHS